MIINQYLRPKPRSNWGRNIQGIEAHIEVKVKHRFKNCLRAKIEKICEFCNLFFNLNPAKPSGTIMMFFVNLFFLQKLLFLFHFSLCLVSTCFY